MSVQQTILQRLYEEGHAGHYVRQPKTGIILARCATFQAAMDEVERRNGMWDDMGWPVDVVTVPDLRPHPEEST